jgi:hypothetical protein
MKRSSFDLNEQKLKKTKPIIKFYKNGDPFDRGGLIVAVDNEVYSVNGKLVQSDVDGMYRYSFFDQKGHHIGIHACDLSSLDTNQHERYVGSDGFRELERDHGWSVVTSILTKMRPFFRKTYSYEWGISEDFEERPCDTRTSGESLFQGLSPRFDWRISDYIGIWITDRTFIHMRPQKWLGEHNAPNILYYIMRGGECYSALKQWLIQWYGGVAVVKDIIGGDEMRNVCCAIWVLTNFGGLPPVLIRKRILPQLVWRTQKTWLYKK